MQLKQTVIDVADYILIAMFFVVQVGLFLYTVNYLFDLIPSDYRIEAALAGAFAFIFANFFFLVFIKIALLLERKPTV